MLRSLNVKISSIITFLNEKKLAVYLIHQVSRIYFQNTISQEGKDKKCKRRQQMWTNKKEKTQMASRFMKSSTLLAIKKWKW